MTDPFTVPAEMRDFANRSVHQARNAFEGFMGAIKKSAGAFETATSSASSNVAGVTSKAVSFAETNVTAALDLAEKLVHAKDIQEVMALQTEYLKAQFAAIQDQTRELGDALGKAVQPSKP